MTTTIYKGIDGAIWQIILTNVKKEQESLTSPLR